MNNTQKVLLSIYIPITFLILILDDIFTGENIVLYLKYTVVITLFLCAITMKKRFKEQKIMTVSLFFIVIADFFLVFSNTLTYLNINLVPFGIAGFFFAYLCLIAAYQKNFSFKKSESIAAMLIIFIYIFVFIILKPYVKGVMFIGTAVFLFTLCYMTWTSICTIFRKYYSPKVSKIIAVSGVFMLICDIGVGFGLFYPVHSNLIFIMLKNIVWAVYIPAWALLDVIIAEENLT